MAAARESEILTQLGAGTPMGELMRQYWLPAALSSELVADAAPMRLMLLGERLIAFRDTAGRIGVMDHRCPHRRASLFYGRNEEGGLCCVYHGWKFDTDGNCLEMPNVPPRIRLLPPGESQDVQGGRTQRSRVGVHGVAQRSSFFTGAARFPPGVYDVRAAECNWLQALEGDIDTSHFGFLHVVGSVKPDEVPDGSMLKRYAIADRAPHIYVTRTEWGTMYGARRMVDGKIYWRLAPFAFTWTMPPEDVQAYLLDPLSRIPA